MEARRRLMAWLRLHPCSVCGESDPLVLEFHHCDDSSKKHDITRMIDEGYGWEKLLAEIMKCTVLCANDHRRETARRAGYWKTWFHDE